MAGKQGIVVVTVVEFVIDPDEVDDGDESRLISDLVGACVKVKSGVFENRFMGDIASAYVAAKEPIVITVPDVDDDDE